ncbi:conserved oligomeric Golgi complex subunit 3-like [Clytia hemisphaerica]|uniref:Conserved oligomeric Golgi complex subunit 3 n=1 Tax=Clytia hemisphaerica TaxID=252671 RepID=A0A7M5WSP2_9CNID|eukprot:TCONS_00052073-protein
MASISESSSDKSYLNRLSQWDSRSTSLAPLSDKQRECVIELNTLTQRPIPEKFRHRKRTSDSVSSLPEDDEISKHIASLDLGTRKIENAQQFFSWFSQVQVQMGEEQERNYREYRDDLQDYVDRCHTILSEVQKVLDNLTNLEKQHVFVSTQTRALHDACEQSLHDQANLMEQAESIANSLSYFKAYESIKHKLTTSTLTVTGESFIPLLKKIDDSILYIEAHPDYKESAVYLARFKACLNQALQLVKQYVVNVMRNTASQSVEAMKIANQPSLNVNDSNYTALYGKFKTQAIRIKSIMEKLEEREKNSKEYEQLISDCQQCYLEYRWQIMSPFIHETIDKMSKQHTRNPCTLFRSGCSFMLHICRDEYQLYHEFFTHGKLNFDTLMENVCGILYDTFRPLIIQMTHMETLAELCNILKVEMLEDHIQKRAEQLSSFQVIVSEMLEDVQERLVYRTQTYISKDIAGYSPAPGDLAYPDKLMMELGTNDVSIDSDDKSAISRKGATAVVDLQAMWYPTVRRTLVCLSKLYNSIGKPTFEGIAQEALSCCIVTLKYASNEITKKKGAINGHLFLIKHLLILREQISPFDVDFAIKEVSLDFTKLRSAAYGLFAKGSQILSLNSNNALLEFLLEGVPQMTEYYIDSKQEVDAELKTVCERFISETTDSFIAPLNALLDKIDTILKMAEQEGKNGQQLLKQQPFAKADAVRKIVSETYMLLKSKLPSTLQSLALYLANKDTEYILFKPVTAKVLKTYKQLNTVVVKHYDHEDQQIIGCPSQEQVSLLMAFH